VNQARHRSEILQSFKKQIHNAKKRIWFATAYLVPPRRLRKTLKRAARSGLDVRLLVPGPITDHPGVRYASHRHYGRLLTNGVRIFEYQPRFFHAKTVLCDDWVAIGSSNFDRWNLRWNLEASQEIIDEDFAVKVEAMFITDFANSVEIDYRNWLQRSWYLRLRQWFWRVVERFSHTIGR
jgi:phosphatidylserine/phosphatidylglycerophosphate/cardiolipin synthase-like enzyme